MNLIFKKGTSLELSTYVGPEGSIALNTETGEIHLQDGVTPGGHARAKPEALQDVPDNALYIREQSNWVSLDTVQWDLQTLDQFVNLGPIAGFFYYYSNLIKINKEGALINSYNNIGTSRTYLAGAGVNNVCIYYGGGTINITNTVTRVDADGALVGSETAIGTARTSLAGAPAGDSGLYYGGGYESTTLNKTTAILSTGVLRVVERNIGTARYGMAGAGVGGYGVYYGGINSSTMYSYINRITELCVSSSSSSLGTARCYLAGAGIGDIGVYYGGKDPSGTTFNIVTMVTKTLSTASAEVNLGVKRGEHAGTLVGDYAVFYGGRNSASIVTRIDANGALVGSETTVSGGTRGLAAASV